MIYYDFNKKCKMYSNINGQSLLNGQVGSTVVSVIIIIIIIIIII